MAGIKIVDLPPLGRDLASTDLLELSLAGGTGSRKITGQEIMNTSKLNIGTTAITSGTVGRVLFEGTGNVVQESANLFWDNTNGRLGIGTSSPQARYSQSQTQGILAHYGITNANADQNRGVWEFYTNTAVTPDFFGRFGFKFEGGINNTSRQFQLHVGDNTNPRFVVNGSGNVLINTTTDAGFRLDVNGTARVQSNGTFGITNTRILTIRPEDTSGAYGNSCSIRGGVSNGRLDFYSATNITELRDNIILLTSATGPSVQVGTGSINLNVGGTRLQVAPTTGNVLIGTTTDDGFRLDVNGTARVQNTLTTSAGIISNGTVRVTATTASPSGNASFFVFDGAEGTNFAYDYGTATYKALAYNGSLVRFLTGGTERARFAITTGNFLINTTTDAGFRLDVNGTARVSGNVTVSGNTTITGSFIANSAGTGYEGFKIQDGGTARFVAERLVTNFLGIGHNSSAGRWDDVILGASQRLYFYTGASERARFAATTGNFLIGTTTDVASSLVTMNSTTQGFLPPRMTQTQRNAIASPAIGLEIYQTDATEGKYIYKSSGWTYIG